ncbi:hypothetical protein BpHYR1_010743 [Brachionus plicatilis]|uniref:Uncharacterized protein n=1 Tax=Brachionus plicatilis TaxID=10195 RepID=A0A3M7P3J9_BRAPC|nr:hypothetical protein BpHYR1_010743 [Brachionus plicatilis]
MISQIGRSISLLSLYILKFGSVQMLKTSFKIFISFSGLKYLRKSLIKIRVVSVSGGKVKITVQIGLGRQIDLVEKINQKSDLFAEARSAQISSVYRVHKFSIELTAQNTDDDSNSGIGGKWCTVNQKSIYFEKFKKTFFAKGLTDKNMFNPG